MKHPTKDHYLFGIDMIEELVEEYFQPNNYSEDIKDSTRSIINCLEADSDEVQESLNSEDNYNDVTELAFEVELTELLDQICYLKTSERTNNAEVKTNPSPLIEKSPPLPPMELKPLPSHLKYAYLDIIITNNLHQEQEDKLLEVLRQHKKAIGWKLSDLPSINPSICMHRILMEEDIKPIRQQQRRLNPTILDVVKKEVTKLLTAGIIYPISESQWVSPVQVVPKKSGMTIMKNQQDELATCKDHFPFPFIDQILEKLSGKSHYCFLDEFSGYKSILHPKTSTKQPSRAHLVPLRTHACHLACVMHRAHSNVA
ncbi:hypothetical protein CR513_26601, partial [Mucuna pruriens]